MASRSLGSLTLDLIARVGGFVQGMDRAARISEERMKQIQASAVKAGKMVGAGLATGVAAGATALTAMAVSAVDTAAEISNLARMANVSTTDFQRLAAGSQAVGIEQDKLADILKDVNDKVGDFLNTGGGEMKDFFEQIAPKVGVTADQFRNLSGSQALGLYVSSLEKAKVSQSDMTFYMEAIANDATALLPLLRNNAEGFKRFGDAAEAAGAIMDEKTIRAAQELKAATWLVETSVSGVSNEIKAALLPMLSGFAGKLTDVTTNSVLTKKVADDLADSVKVLGKMAVGAVGGLHMLGVGLKGLHELDEAMVGGEDAKWWDRYLPPVRVYNAFKNFGDMGDSINKSKADIKDLAEMYKGLLDGIDQPAAPGATNQVKELADLMEQMRSGGAGSFKAVTPGDQQAAKELANSLKTAATGYAQLKAQYDPAGAAVDEFSKQTAQLSLLMKNGKITQQEFAEGTEWVARAFNDAIQASSGMAELMKYQAELEKALANQRAQYQLAADSIGMGSKEAGRYQERLQLEQENNEKILGLRTELATTSDALRRRDLETQIALIEEYQPKQLAIMQEGWHKIDDAQADWMKGVTAAWADYSDSARDMAGQMYDVTSSAFDSLENELVDFVKTGEFNFGNFAEGIAEDLLHMLVKVGMQMALNAAIGDTAAASSAALAAATGTAMATAYAPAAAMASLASFGANAAPASAAITSTTALASSLSLVGMAHDGIDSVPREGTWLLQKGERVTTAGTSAKLDRTLNEIQEGYSGGSGSGQALTVNQTFHVNGDVSPQTVAMMAAMCDQAVERSAARVFKDARTNGPITQQMRKSIR